MAKAFLPSEKYKGIQKYYGVEQFFENWDSSFSLYEVVTNSKGDEDLRIIGANRTFANIISADYETLLGRTFTDACPMALDWLSIYIDCAKTGIGNINESYNYDLQKYLTAIVFSPQIGQVAILVIDRTHLWEADQKQRGRNQDFALLFSSMSSGFCIGKMIRDEQGNAIDVLFEMVNSAFELLEGVPTATLQGKRLLSIKDTDMAFEKYVEVVNHKSKTTFTKFVPENQLTLEYVCFSQGEDIFVCIVNDISKRIQTERELKEAHETILSGIQYASKLQNNLLPPDTLFEKAFTDFSIIWKPRDIVGGDIYWIKNFEKGTVLCVCDCTGHGMPGALLTMLVATTLDDCINEDNCCDTAEILWNLERKFINVFGRNLENGINGIRDGCDIAALFIAKDGRVTISSANMHIYICNGKEVIQLRGQRLFIGEGDIKNKDKIKITQIPSSNNNKFYIASDGLCDQPGGASHLPFGYQKLKKIILENYHERQSVITDKIWAVFEAWRGEEKRVDDFELISFKI